MKILIKKYFKKSQMEAFGLAMIVILLMLGLFIVLVFRIANPNLEESPNKEYIYNELAVNFVNSAINVNVKECYDTKRTVAELIRDCAKRTNTVCSGESACTLVNRTLYQMLNKTLIYRRDAFIFYTDGLNWPNSGDEITFSNNGCTRLKDSGQTGYFYVTLHPEPRGVHLYLNICKQ
jgi:hypothetical protein